MGKIRLCCALIPGRMELADLPVRRREHPRGDPRSHSGRDHDGCARNELE